VAVVFRGALHPAAFAGCVLRELLALEGQTSNVDGTVRLGRAGTGTDKGTLVVTVASEERSAVGGGLASSLDGLHRRGVAGRAELHESLAFPAGLRGTSVGLVVPAVSEAGRIGGEDTVGHHGASHGGRVGIAGHDAAKGDKEGEDGELHDDFWGGCGEVSG